MQTKQSMKSVSNPSDEAAFTLLQQVTCDCKDNGESFVVCDRIDVIKQSLQGTSYQLLAEEGLFLLYGKKPLQPGDSLVLISSHIDCVFTHCFCEEEGECYRGTFDNSFTNAALLYAMQCDAFADNVVIAFTGDEEKDSGGAVALNVYLTKLECTVKFALVLDVTLAGWDNGKLLAIENDLGVDLLTAHQLVEWLKPYQEFYEFLHFAEPDETWDYADYGIPCLTLSAPVSGSMHSDEGVIVHKATFPLYCEVLVRLANGLSRWLLPK